MKKRRQVLSFLVVLSVITFLDRISISVAAARMQDDLHISTAHWGWILGAFVLAYGIFEMPTGAMGDRLGARRVLTRVVLWWSVFTALTGFAWGFLSLLVIRFLFGTGEAGAYPNIAAALSHWFPVESRARAQGLIWGASRFGGALAPLIVVPLQRAVGWRATFVLLGAIGGIWAFVWQRWYHDRPAEQPGISSQELLELPAPREDSHSRTDWRTLWKSKQMRLLFAMYWCYGWGPWFYFAWFPLYLAKGAHFSEKEIGVYAALPYVLGTIANLIGGVVCDRLNKRLGIKIGGRLVGSLSLTMAALVMLAMTHLHQKALLVAVSAMGLGFADLMVPAAWAVAMSMGGNRSGVVTGAMNTAGQLGGFVCSVMAGYLVEATGSYNAPVAVVAVVLLVAATLFSRIDGSTPIFAGTDTITVEPL